MLRNLVQVLPIAVALVGSGTARAADPRIARLALELSVDEIQRCCRGDLRRADFDAQRRWAYNFHRWLVESGGRPDFSALADFATLERQCGRIPPGYAAVVAVHPRTWLEENRRALPDGGGVAAADRFAEALQMLVPLEVERRRAVVEHDRERRRIDEVFERAIAGVESSRALIEAELAATRAEDRRFDPGVAFATRRAGMQRQIDDLEKRINAHKEEFWGYEQKWDEANKSFAYGSSEYDAALAEFEDRAKLANDAILALTDELVALTLRRDALTAANAAAILDEIEAPPKGSARRLGRRSGNAAD